MTLPTRYAEACERAAALLYLVSADEFSDPDASRIAKQGGRDASLLRALAKGGR